MHDIGDTLAPANHAEIGAAIMKPYVSEANHWMMDKHGVFQGYYFFHISGSTATCASSSAAIRTSNTRAQFCHLYDQTSFDPDYDTMPLEAFEPMLRRVVGAPKHSIYRAAAARAPAS